MVSRSNNKLKNLNIQPLSMAKYFWSKGVEVLPINQQLTYFTYLEALKDGYLLFEEEWKAWPNGPAVESAFDKMFDNYDKLDKLFVKVENLDNELVIDYANKVFKKYHKVEPYLIFEKAQNKPWKDARKPLKSERDISNIELASLIKFTNGNGKRVRAF